MCEVKIFLPLKKGTIERKTQTRVRFTLSLSLSLSLSLDSFALALCPNLSSLFSLVRKKKRKKKSNQISFPKRWIFPRIPPLFVIIITWNYSLSARKERVGEKGEDKRV